MRFGFFIRESVRSLRRNAAPGFAAMATVLLTMLVLGVFIPIVQATNGAADDVSQRVFVDVYMKPGASKQDIKRVRSQIERAPHVGSVRFESKQQAYKREQAKRPELYNLLGKTNPLPDTFHVYPDDPQQALAVKSALTRDAAAGGAIPVDRSIAKVANRKSDTKKILQATRFVKLTVGVLALLLIGASIFLIANTIRLSLFARRREVEVMKLVGATDWFIRWPFVIEGIIVGAIGAGVAIVILALAKITLLDPLAENFALVAAPRTIGFPLLVAIIVGAGIAVSALGSGMSLRRFLRV